MFQQIKILLGILFIIELNNIFVKTKYNDLIYDSNYESYLNFGNKKVIKNNDKLINSVLKSKIDFLGPIFKNNINKIKYQNNKLDLVFLIDSSSSVGQHNFNSEIKFVKKMLSDFTVSFNHTRVAVVTYSSQDRVIRHVDQVSKPDVANDKCLLLKYELPRIKYIGGGTYTLGAFLEAQKIFATARQDSLKVLFLITDGFSNGGDPSLIAEELKRSYITIFTIGIQNGNQGELYRISSEPGELHSYLLDSFMQFESLASALHMDLHAGHKVPVSNNSLCNFLCEDDDSHNENCCDKNAACSCGTNSGHYSCVCSPGYYGSGLINSCTLCPKGTYWDSWNLCKPCPDINHITELQPATDISACKCKPGFRSSGLKCEVKTCPKLNPPTNGYFVNQPSECSHVLYAGCGVRCKSGYQLVGSSVRHCQLNETWSGIEPKCLVKTCPPLQFSHKEIIQCKNDDLGLTYKDFSENINIIKKNSSENETLFTNEMPIDTECTFKCPKGSSLVGSKIRNCLPLSKWDGLNAYCKSLICQPLPPVAFGEYFPVNCSTEKSPHGKKCEVKCNPGYIAKGPPIRTCVGRKIAQWSDRTKTSKCIDQTPPNIQCPDNVVQATEALKNYSVFYDFPQPNVTDAADVNFVIWSKPAVPSEGIKLYLGNHTITFIAMDAFRNKARCNFTISIIDEEPPTIENCFDPPEYITDNINGANITWDLPIFYDNSHTPLKINKSHEFGFYSLGEHNIKYIATDEFNNTNTCILNLTLQVGQCNEIISPNNAEKTCNEIETGMNCVITCQEGYAFAIRNESSLEFSCQNTDAVWYSDSIDMIPNCTVTQLPNSFETNTVVTLETEQPICNDSALIAKLQEEMKNNINSSIEQLCGNDLNCDLKDAIASCTEIIQEILEEETNKIDFRRKRNTDIEKPIQKKINKRKKKRSKIDMKFTLVGNVSQKGEAANKRYVKLKNQIRQINLLEFKDEATLIELKKLQIKIKNLEIKETITCGIGSAPKRSKCVQCPPGTFHNNATNACQTCPIGSYSSTPGSLACTKCPLHTSTKKAHSKNLSDCKGECPPGTFGRVRRNKNPKINRTHTSLMPFCRKCVIGEYQSMYNQISCQKCPEGYITVSRGSRNQTDCVQKVNPCKGQLCNGRGKCVVDKLDTANCICEDGFTGSRCEMLNNSCESSPCYNGGTCEENNPRNGTYNCICRKGFSGKHCEEADSVCIQQNICRNNGVCSVLNDEPSCLCSSKFTGSFCETISESCLDAPCGVAGICQNLEAGFFCKCAPGFMGRRCHLRPCDFLPCHTNSICINLEDENTTRRSYKCECPKGYKGVECKDVVDPCEENSCGLNGKCTSNSVLNIETGEEKNEITCKCDKTYYGPNCESKSEPDFILQFLRSGITDYIKVDGPNNDLTEISICVWLQSHDTFNYGTIFSYATVDTDNAFTITDYNGFVFYVNGEYRITDVLANDGSWHFVCVTWTNINGNYKIYLDGKLKKMGSGLGVGSVIKANGTLIVGQEQDSLGSSFSESESFLGKISHLDTWDRVLSQKEILDLISNCDHYYGNVYTWADLKFHIHGDIKIQESWFCKNCSLDLILENGKIDFVNNSAVYSCSTGYGLWIAKKNIKENLFIRRCSKTSQWEGHNPVCLRKKCGFPGYLRDGDIRGKSYFFNDTITYVCNEGFTLQGEEIRVCLNNGSWSGKKPICAGVQCDYLRAPEGGTIEYLSELPVDVADLYIPVWTQAEFNCSTKIVGENILTCQENGTWDFEVPTCTVVKALTCDQQKAPSAPNNGYVSDTTKSHFGKPFNSLHEEDVNAATIGTRIHYRCRYGYKLQGRSFTECLGTGLWSKLVSICQPVKCAKPPNPPNPLMKLSNTYAFIFKDLRRPVEYHFGNMLTYQCVDGYFLNGEKSIRCKGNGRWSRMTSKCSRISCNKPNVGGNVKITGTSYLFQDKLSVECQKDGIIKRFEMICHGNATWLPQISAVC